MSADFDLVDTLRQVAAKLTAGGVRSASPDPAEVVTPGVWVQCSGWDPATLAGGLAVDLVLLLVADPDAGPMRAVADLSELYREVTAVFPPSGRVTPALAPLDAQEAPLPSLSIPVRVRWTPTH